MGKTQIDCKWLEIGRAKIEKMYALAGLPKSHIRQSEIEAAALACKNESTNAGFDLSIQWVDAVTASTVRPGFVGRYHAVWQNGTLCGKQITSRWYIHDANRSPVNCPRCKKMMELSKEATR